MIIAVTAGLLVGDAWMVVPCLRDLCSDVGPIKLVCATYDRFVFEWAQKHVTGCDWEIIHTFANEDRRKDGASVNESIEDLVPFWGHHTLLAALRQTTALFPDATIYSPAIELGQPLHIGSYYHPKYWRGEIELKALKREASGSIVVQPYTRHEWKNCGEVLRHVRFTRRALMVGLPEEAELGFPFDFITGGFEAQAEQVAGCTGFVGVLSSWTNLAILLRKPQIIVAMSEGNPGRENYEHPGMTWMIDPSAAELQNAITERGW
jgi:hypothetical protein